MRSFRCSSALFKTYRWKNEATLCALPGSVIDALIQYPEQFGVFPKFFVSEKIATEMKRKVLHTMRVLGALGPYTRKYVVRIFGFVLRCY